jgi:putative Mg2+ transporter-C (MgtC) family protein
MSVEAELTLLGQVLAALGLGGVVGLEREYRGFEAGIRTTALVAAGAAVFGAVSMELGDSRVAAGVVQGVGFLGAGLILHEHSGVRNLTTAATIWVAAGIGLATSMDMFILGIGVTVSTVLMLELQWVSLKIHGKGRRDDES